jgi:hypothetical protein
MTETRTAPILLVDLDAVIDMSPWQALAAGKRWIEFFGHLPSARPRHPELLDAIELAKADGCIVNYVSRWPEITSYLVQEWLQANDFPHFHALHRRGFSGPADLLAHQAAVASTRFKGRRPVLAIHADPEVAAEARRDHGLAAIGVAQLPDTTDGLRRLFALARPVTPQERKPA